MEKGMEIWRCAGCKWRYEHEPKSCLNCGGRKFRREKETPEEVCRREGHMFKGPRSVERITKPDFQGFGGGRFESYKEHTCWRCGYTERITPLGCFIASACMATMGFSNDHPELQALRRFRDDYVAKVSDGSQFIEEYYAQAPLIVVAIKARTDAREKFQEIYDGLVVPCLRSIQGGKFEEALSLGREGFLKLKDRFLNSREENGV